MDPDRGPSVAIAVVDVGAITDPDARTLEVLARLQLMARRTGTSIELRNACPRLVALLAVTGLDAVVPLAGVEPGAGSGFEANRQAEERKELGLDEEVDPGDAPI